MRDIIFIILAVLSMSAIFVPLVIILRSNRMEQWRLKKKYQNFLNNPSSTKYRQTHYDRARNQFYCESDVYLTESNESAIELITSEGNTLLAELHFTFICFNTSPKAVDDAESLASQAIRDELVTMARDMDEPSLTLDSRKIITDLMARSSKKLEKMKIDLESIHLFSTLKTKSINQKLEAV